MSAPADPLPTEPPALRPDAASLAPEPPVVAEAARAATPWPAVAAVIIAGMVAATHIGKLPPSLPALREAFGLTLVQASWLVSAFQLAGMLLGLFGGLLADRFGARRTMALGLSLLALASGAGAIADQPATLLALRALESAGFLLTVLPGPALLRRMVPPQRLSRVMGAWSCYMPAGMSAMMVSAPWLIARGGWSLAWWVCAGLSLLALALLRSRIPADAPRAADAQGMAALARATLGTPGAWWLSICFGLYAGQFITVFSFLPSVYQAAGLGAGLAASLSALGVAANVTGNLLAGVMLGRGTPRQWLLGSASVVMAMAAILAFTPDLSFALRYGAALALSAAGGMIPGTLFATAPRVAPHPGAVATTTGLMQQGSALGQFILPPLAAAAASAAGGWAAAGWLLAAVAVLNLGVARQLGRVSVAR